MPAVTVIVPTRKRNHLLPRALTSILAQSFADFEIVVVDDNPPESRVGADPGLRELMAEPRVRLVESVAPRNAARARNHGLAVARGEWVTYLDDDDAYRADKIEKQWRAAKASGLPLGMCGLVFHLRRRRRVSLRANHEVSGEELLLDFPGMPAVFHRCAPEIRFDERLDAAEDMHFYLQLVRYFKVGRVFNVPEALVDIYAQEGLRVNLNREGQWRAAMEIHRQFAWAYGPAAAEVFLLRARLGSCKLQQGHTLEMVRYSMALLRRRGPKELRLVLNNFLFKLPWARRWLVS